jgi:serine/threonine protein kinase
MSQTELDLLQNELGILRSCFCENIVEIIDVFEDLNYMYIVQELIDG